ncbi:MAG: hypothetical protein JWM57_971 [Phycisphaerales bacterium]|nr:hypothetical protein [Phycisphaerales bacterium]
MKIRIRGQSLRFRLGQSEVQALANGQAVEESIVLVRGVTHSYAIRPAAVDSIGLTVDGTTVIVALPKRDIAGWAETDAVGLRAELDIADKTSLRVLIEKDFACIENESGEPQEDAFPNPSATC